MSDHHIVMKLNQQQLELLDRTIAQGVASDRTNLIRLALREYAAKHQGESHQSDAKQTGERK
jgi:metal-responsive CopG/Arc/MetJ family transcriptional regulator